MYNKRHTGLFFFLFIISLGGYGQTTFNSPFSMKGIGDLPNPVLIRNSAMGGISIGMRNSAYIDFNNPAAISARDSLSFVFDFGVNGKSSKLESREHAKRSHDLNLGNLVFSFPVARNMGVALGFVPSAFTGYALNEGVGVDDPLYNPDIGALSYYYKGEGGITRFFAGTAIELFDHLSIGFNFDYLFGKIHKTHELYFTDNNSAFNTRLDRDYIVSDFNFDLGLQYTAHFGEQKRLVIGLIGGTTNKKTRYTEEAYDYAVLLFPNGTRKLDTIKHYTLYNQRITLPPTLGIGFTFSNGEKWTAGADYSYSNWSKASIPFSNDSLIPAQSIRVGFEFSPNPRDFRQYWKIIKYRVGGHYQSSYFTVNKLPVNDFGISFGVGLPIINRGSGMAFLTGRTTFNISIESGWRGNVEKNFVREQYNIIKFGVSVNDLWFIKRKYQ
jgi:hypothetical protein